MEQIFIWIAILIIIIILIIFIVYAIIIVEPLKNTDKNLISDIINTDKNLKDLCNDVYKNTQTINKILEKVPIT